MKIITRKGGLSTIAMTSENPDFGTAWAVVKRYDDKNSNAKEPTTNLEIAIRPPGSNAQYLAYVFAENGAFTYPAGVPVHVLDIDPNISGDQIDGKAGPSGLGWRLNGDLELAANLRISNEGKTRQAWVRVTLREVDGVWREV